VRLYLIRHPEADILEGFCYGSSDLPLRKPWSAAACIAALPPNATVISSPLRRCAEFAHALSDKVQLDARLAELDFGAWEMLAWDDIDAEQLDAWAADPLGFNSHGGESVTQMQLRVREALAELDGSNGDCVWVTHAGVMKLVLAELLALPQDEWLSLRFAHAEITVLEQKPSKPAGSRWSLQSLR